METPFRSHRKVSAAGPILAIALSFAALAGCHKKVTASTEPEPPTPTSPTPTATLTVAPTSINPGDKATLTWHTTDATETSIDGIGSVPSAGTQSVSPTESTDYHLIARGPGGSTDATARVTVAQAASQPAQTDNGMVDEQSFHQNVQDVFFGYDSYDIRPDAQTILAKDASFLAAHPGVKLVVGGYCDDRGSEEYNLALGENRANAVKQALVNAGVSPDRVRTVSYGKEKQFCTEQNESCWQQNRRGGFALDK